MTQVARPDQFSSALINVSISDTSARNTEHRFHRCSGTVCKVWRVNSFAKTVEKLFPASEEWHFWDDPRQSSGDQRNDNANKTVDSLSEHTFFLLPYFVLISVGDALSSFSPLSVDNCE